MELSADVYRDGRRGREVGSRETGGVVGRGCLLEAERHGNENGTKMGEPPAKIRQNFVNLELFFSKSTLAAL